MRLRKHRAFLETEAASVITVGAADHPPNSTPEDRSQTHCAGLTRGHQFVRRSNLLAKCEATEPRLSHHDRNHLTMQRTVVQPYHAVHSHRHQGSEVCVENGRAERSPGPAQYVFAREGDSKTHLFHLRNVALVPVNQ